MTGISGISNYTQLFNSSTVKQGRDPAEMFKKLDSNGDGGLDKTEFSAIAQKLSQDTGATIEFEDAIAEYDANGDGQLGEDEMLEFMKNNAPQHPSQMQPPPSGMEETENPLLMMLQNLGKTEQENAESFFSEIGANSNGSIDQSELQTILNKVSATQNSTVTAEDAISTYDSDGDGVLNSDELQTFMQDNAPAPPTFQMQQAISAYLGENQMDTLFNNLLSEQSMNTEAYSPLNVFA
ncbi:MAG TPA: EF-hand domain-containing protein [bacterium]|nr:EF-hand domain-containing protein [bacterium]HPN41974.1 EF-hand domain-containing protein [bacterium]